MKSRTSYGAAMLVTLGIGLLPAVSYGATAETMQELKAPNATMAVAEGSSERMLGASDYKLEHCESSKTPTAGTHAIAEQATPHMQGARRLTKNPSKKQRFFRSVRSKGRQAKSFYKSTKSKAKSKLKSWFH